MVIVFCYEIIDIYFKLLDLSTEGMYKSVITVFWLIMEEQQPDEKNFVD